jgi:hypothetical protein
MSTEAKELHRIISTSVRDMLDAFRIQAQAGPVTDSRSIVLKMSIKHKEDAAPYVSQI